MTKNLTRSSSRSTSRVPHLEQTLHVIAVNVRLFFLLLSTASYLFLAFSFSRAHCRHPLIFFHNPFSLFSFTTHLSLLGGCSPSLSMVIRYSDSTQQDHAVSGSNSGRIK